MASKRLLGAVRKSLVATLRRRPAIGGLECLATCEAGRPPASLTARERATLVAAYRTYLSRSFDDDLGNASGESEHDELLDALANVSRWLDVRSDAQQDQVRGALAEFEDRAAAQADDVTSPSRPVSKTDAASEDLVRHLFDGLSG